MNFHNIVAIIKKEVRGGIKDPLFLTVFIVPLLFTLIFQLVFGRLWVQKTVIAIFQEGGGSRIVQEFEQNDAIRIIELLSIDAVYTEVKDKKVDVGVIFPENLEDKLKNAEKVILKVYINGESLAKNRTIAGTAIASALRNLSPNSPSVNFEEIQIGEEKSLNLIQQALPIIVLVAILFGTFMLSSTFLVKEKEKRTLSALLVTPLSISELLFAYGLLSVTLSLFMALVILFLNVGFNLPIIILIPLILGSIFGVELGLMLGIFAKDMATIFAAIKSLGIFLYAPAIVLIFPNWPQWIAKIFPTYYIIYPVFRISIFRDSFSKVSLDLAILLGLVVLFFALLVPLVKRLKINQ
ncbi:MAG: ABC transporter permease [Caldiserica bacterium]|nr:ABC transporter permease [Caldisericota bacterium]